MDGKPIDFPIGGAFDDYSNSLSDKIDQRKDIKIVPDIIFVSEAGMEHLTQEAIISGIGVDIKDNPINEVPFKPALHKFSFINTY